MTILYNLEINICTISLLLILKFAIKHSSTNLSVDKLCFHYMLNLNILYSVADVFTVVLKGTHFPWSRIGMEIADMVYIETMTVISYIWVLYVFIRIGKTLESYHKWFLAIPLIGATIIMLTNPLTEIVFSINDQNYYARGIGLYFHWSVAWFYIIFGTVIAIRAICKAENVVQKRELTPLVYFIICPSVASIFQMLFYGLSTTQTGLAIGMVLIFAITIGNEVSADSLTGLNNRGSLEHFILNHLDNIHEQYVTAFMMDLNDFKTINDKLGHTMGDIALRTAADILKQACVTVDERMFLCRYGGDEFVIIGRDFSDTTISQLVHAINDISMQKNKENHFRYTIEFSIGVSNGICRTYDDFDKLLKQADEAMYFEKKRIKASR